MLTTTIDGLWVLQVLTGIEVLAPELGLRPHLPSVEPKRLALEHPVTADLRAAGVIGAAGDVDSTVVEWLTVLSRRDIGLLMHFQTPSEDQPPRALLARFAQWWVALERSGDLVRLSGRAFPARRARLTRRSTGKSSDCAGRTRPRPLTRHFGRGCHACCFNKPGSLVRILRQSRSGTRAVATVETRGRSGAVGSGVDCRDPVRVDTGRPTRTYIEQGAVAIIDTLQGRLVAEHIASGGARWMIIAPGTRTNVASAIHHMVRRLPAEEEWHSYRKVV